MISGRLDSALARATEFDDEYAEAHLWLATVRSWGGAEPAQWRINAEQSALRIDDMSELHRVMSSAISAQAHGDYGNACPLWRDLIDHAPLFYAGWYAWATCQTDDDAVIVEQQVDIERT